MMRWSMLLLLLVWGCEKIDHFQMFENVTYSRWIAATGVSEE